MPAAAPPPGGLGRECDTVNLEQIFIVNAGLVVHGHGAVVTRNSWKDSEGGKSSREQRTKETWEGGGAVEGPSQLCICLG